MSQKTLKPVSVENIWIFLALILLVGILMIAYGYYQESKLVLYLGLTITLIGVINGVFRIVIHPKK
jgi:membrane protein YdbS with pleckstrin-like domain